MVKSLKAGIIAGLIVFIWGSVSWMFLPWHKTTIHHFTDEKAVAATLLHNVSTSGIYVLPAQMMKETREAIPDPMVFTSINLQGPHTSMLLPSVISLINQIVVATLIAGLLCCTAIQSYLGRLGFVVVFALAAGLSTHICYWDWFRFDLNYTLVEIGDLIVAWFLGGIVLAKCCKP